MVGRIFPQGGPRPTSSAGERRLYDTLAKQLPEGWTAWHSMRLRIHDRYEGEGD